MRMRVDLSNLSFLILDDNMHMRQILRSIMAGFGARRIYDAADGADGLEIVIDRRPDVVICDWAMTPVSGADFLRLLRRDRDKALATTPVIVITAHARKPVIVEAIQIGVHGFVAKPIAPAVLFNRVEAALLHQDEFGRSLGTLKLPGTRPQDSAGRDVVDLTGASARSGARSRTQAGAGSRAPDDGLGLAFL